MDIFPGNLSAAMERFQLEYSINNGHSWIIIEPVLENTTENTGVLTYVLF